MPTQKTFKYDINSFKYKHNEDSEEQANRILHFAILKSMKEDLGPFSKLFVITGLLMEITNKELLLSTKSLFNDTDFSELSEKISLKINNNKHIYSESQIIRIFSIIIGNYIRYKRMKPKDCKGFSFKINRNNITIKSVDFATNFKRKVISEIPNIFQNDIKAYDQLIGIMDKIDFNRGSDYLEREIKFLERQKKKIFALEKNPYPKVFVDLSSYIIFKEYIDKHYLDPYKELSFIFYQLQREHRLVKIKHLEFAKFLLDNDFINEKTHTIISYQKGFSSKSNSDSRLNNYNNILIEIDRYFS
tara:strand:+ start:38220 stop:39128 length:909 start_codon:yes stop_codon:yes gene_type:complete